MEKLLTTTFIIFLFLGSCKDSSQQKNTNTQNKADIKDEVSTPHTSNTLDSIADSETIAKISLPEKTAVISRKDIKSSNTQSTKIALYRLRKYENVTQFYSQIAKPATDL